MKKVFKKISHIILVVVMLAGTFVLGGCSWIWVEREPRPSEPPRYTRSECGAWWFSHWHETTIALVSVREEYLSTVVDEKNFLHIPTEVDGYRVTQLGDFLPMGSPPLVRRSRIFYEGGSVNRIVIPDGIFVAEMFWEDLYRFTSYVEFLAEEPNVRFETFFRFERFTLIVPDGSIEKYLSRWHWMNFIERSAFYNNINNKNRGEPNK